MRYPRRPIYPNRARPGMGAITDFLCSESTVAAAWQDQIRTMLTDSLLTTVLTGAAGGLLGGLLGRPILGAVVGGAAGMLLHGSQMTGWQR